MTDLLDRAHGALLGLAAGDASGFPSRYHRMVRAGGRRHLLWTQAIEADENQVNKFPLPYTHSVPLASESFSATDDAEQAALGSAILLRVMQNRADARALPTAEELFDAWKAIVLPQADDYWGSVADKSAILNALAGLSVPHTGSDNPHFYDDSAVARSLPVGIAYASDPTAAATVARRLASITNDEVGVDAAAAFAATIAATLAGASLRDAIELGTAEIMADSWLGRTLGRAESILRASGTVFDAIPRWNDEVANLEYNFGNVAPETLPLALIIARESGSFAEAIGTANLVPKQADTMPAMVGALLGAAHGSSAIPASWRDHIETLRGYCVPSTAGARLRELAEQLVPHS